jgi:hypothetical protein
MAEYCPQDYTGKEHRIGPPDRRAKCMYHEAHEEKFVSQEERVEDLKEKQKTVCHNLEITRLELSRGLKEVDREVKAKVPMKLFYVMIGLVIAILAFQWTTYERVNSIALNHIEAMGEITVDIAAVKSNIENMKNINILEKNQITQSMDSNQMATKREIEKVQDSINEIKVAIDSEHGKKY